MEKGEITHLASLARINITDDEADELRQDIDSVLEYVSVVSDIAAADNLTKKVGARYNVFRKDEVTNEPGACTEAILHEMPHTEGQHMKVKKILSQD